MKVFKSTFCICLLLGILGSASGAGIKVVGNLPSNQAGIGLGLNTNVAGAAGFTMLATPLTLVEADLGFDRFGVLPPPAVELFNDIAGSPGVSQVSFTNTTAGLDRQIYTYSADSQFTLQANTKYWLVAVGTNLPSSGSVEWTQADPANAYSGSFATHNNIKFSVTTTAGPWINLGGVLLDYEIRGNVATSPSLGSLGIMLALAVLLFSGVFRHYKKN